MSDSGARKALREMLALMAEHERIKARFLERRREIILTELARRSGEGPADLSLRILAEDEDDGVKLRLQIDGIDITLK